MGIAKDRLVVLSDDVVVNAETISAIAAGDTFAGTRKPRFAGLRRLARALGFGPPETPQRPALRHPLDRLVFHNFAIYELYRGQPGRQVHVAGRRADRQKNVAPGI